VPGATFSFYSYKGGVGRSMALANLAVLFHRRPLDVVVVDWDLEAPGIERYLADRFPGADPLAVDDRPGLCDLIREYRARLDEPPEPDEEPASPYPDLDRFLVTLDRQHGCSLRLLTAGDRSDWGRYAAFVQSFDWADFYASWGGGGFFEWLRDGLAERADVVLIDTRTGITEMGGVATRQMADVIVVLFAGNEENMHSSARMAHSFLAGDPADRSGRPLSVMLVPSRIDDSDSAEYAAFHSRLAVFDSVPAAPVDGYRLPDLILPYRARLAFREQLIVGDEQLETVLGPLVEGYQRIAANMQQLAPEPSRMRHGAGVAAGRVCLLSRPKQRAADAEIRAVLADHGFDVLPTVPGATPDQAELASSTCVLVLLDQDSVASRLLTQVLGLADQLGKTVIPVLMERGLNLPLSLADIVPLDWTDPASRSPDRLLRAARATVPDAAPAGEPPPPTAGPPRPARPKVFVSHGHADAAVARKVAHDLSEGGVAAWLDVDELAAGDSWIEQSQAALDQVDGVVVLVSPALLRNRLALQEIRYAQGKGLPVVPLTVEPVEGERLPLELATTHVLDATGPSYERAVGLAARTLREAADGPRATHRL
jgi:hypothetical protein